MLIYSEPLPDGQDAGEDPDEPVLAVAAQPQQPAPLAVAAQSDAENLQDTIQGVGRPRVAGRLLPEPGRLVRAERSQCGPGELRLLMVRLYQPSDAALRSYSGQ